MYKLIGSVVIGICLAGAALPSLAAEAASPVKAEDFVKALAPNPDAPKGVKTRGFSLGTGEAQPTAQAVAPRKISFQVEFDYNSDKLSAKAGVVLDELAKALASPELASSRFLVTGHTDAAGSADYNLKLSKRRAASVKEYLATKGGVDAKRLESLGRGSEVLADPANPKSGVNRRVEIANIGG